MRWFALLFLLATSCSEASAKNFRGRGARAVGGQGTVADATAITGAGQTWTTGYDGTGCVTSPDWDNMVPAVGDATCILPETSTQDYTCNVSTTGLNGNGLGLSRVGKAFTLSNATGADWVASSGICSSLGAGIPDGQKFLTRIIFRIESGGIPASSFAFLLNRDANNFTRLNFSTSEAAALTFRSAATSYAPGTSVLTIGSWLMLDVMYDGTLTNPVITECYNGTCEVETQASINLGGIGTLASVSLFSNGGSNVWRNVTVAFIGFAIGSDASWWSTDNHTRDKNALGL